MTETTTQEQADAGREIAAAVDWFFRGLGYTAPEAVGDRINKLGSMITPHMRVFGLPKERQA